MAGTSGPFRSIRQELDRYVQQETFLFSDTLGENIAYGTDGGTDNGTEGHVAGAAEVSQIARDVEDFPKGSPRCSGTRHHPLRRAETAHEHRACGDAQSQNINS